MFALDLQRIRRDLKLNTLIQDAAVDRVLPDLLRVRVTEREPIAQFTTWQQPSPKVSFRPMTFYLDEEGFLLMPSDLPKLSVEIAQHFEHLPRLMAVNIRELSKGKPVGPVPIQAALRLIVEFNRSPIAALADLQEIDLATSGVLEVTTPQNSRIIFGLEDFQVQLQRWQAVYEYAANAGKAIASLDLSVSNNVPARWQEVSLVPPVQTKAPKPPRYRKKHV